MSRRVVVAGLATVAAVLLVLLVILLVRGGGSEANGSDSNPTTGKSVQPSVPARTTAVPVPSGGSVKETVTPAPPAATRSAGSKPSVEIPGEMVVEVVSIEKAKNPEAVGPGALAGPVAVVTVKLTNEQSTPVDMTGVAVRLTDRDDRVATPVQSTIGRPFTGFLERGASATGVYVFTIPDEGESRFTVDVQYGAGTDVASIRVHL